MHFHEWKGARLVNVAQAERQITFMKEGGNLLAKNKSNRSKTGAVTAIKVIWFRSTRKRNVLAQTGLAMTRTQCDADLEIYVKWSEYTVCHFEVTLGYSVS